MTCMTTGEKCASSVPEALLDTAVTHVCVVPHQNTTMGWACLGRVLATHSTMDTHVYCASDVLFRAEFHHV